MQLIERRRTKRQLERLNPKKMGFWEAKHGLKSKIWIRANLVLIFEGPKTVEREEKGRRRRRGREEEEKRRGREEQKGMEL